MQLLRNKVFRLVSLGHFFIDILSGTRGIVFAYLSVPLAMSNSILALISAMYMISGSLSQPFFGYLADRIGTRRVMTGSMLWMASLFSLAMLSSGWVTVILLILCSLGSGAYHPSGYAEAINGKQVQILKQENSAASIFMVFGTVGFFIGPMAGGVILASWGLHGLLILSFLLMAFGLVAANQYNNRFGTALAINGGTSAASTGERINIIQNGLLLPILLISINAAIQSWIDQNVLIFLPKYLIELGEPASVYGLLTGVFVAGYAIGNLAGGSIADRVGKKPVIICGILGACIPFIWMASNGYSSLYFLFVLLAGILCGAAYSVTVVVAQKIIPGGRATASGLALGFMFTGGALGTMLTGIVADTWGYLPVFSLNAILGLVCGLMIIGLKVEN